MRLTPFKLESCAECKIGKKFEIVKYSNYKCAIDAVL